MTAEPILARWIAGRDASRGEVAELFGRIVDGELGEPLIAALLVALAAKGESIEEIAGAVEAMRARVRTVPHSRPEVVDTCGTGGDGRGTMNVSTAAAFVAAAGGATVAKHGNRAISSRSGSADVLAALGVPIEVEPELAGRQLDALGLAFLFAPLHHPAMRNVAPVRRALGVRTLFNLVGPLTNPASARRQVIGVFAVDRVEPVARVLVELGCDHALVVHGLDGLDEITTTAPTRIAEVRGGEVRLGSVTPEDLGLEEATLAELLGGTPAENAVSLLRILEGESGALSDLIAANAGAALYVAGRVESLRQGVDRAREILSSGTATGKLEELKRFR